MNRSARRVSAAVCVLAACLGAGCAGSGLLDAAPDGRGVVRTPDGQTLAPQAALAAVALGRSTKADVRDALGPAIAIPFDSGYEVWVYRWPGPDKTPRGATELVLLFDPAGVAAKARVRPGVAPRD